MLNPLRFEDEFVRHKMLDVIGDLALVGHPIRGHLVVHRGGHALHTAFAAELLRQPDAWRFVEAPATAADGVGRRGARVAGRVRPSLDLRSGPRSGLAPRLRFRSLRARLCSDDRASIRSFSNRLKLMNRLSFR